MVTNNVEFSGALPPSFGRNLVGVNLGELISVPVKPSTVAVSTKPCRLYLADASLGAPVTASDKNSTVQGLIAPSALIQRAITQSPDVQIATLEAINALNVNNVAKGSAVGTSFSFSLNADSFNGNVLQSLLSNLTANISSPISDPKLNAQRGVTDASAEKSKAVLQETRSLVANKIIKTLSEASITRLEIQRDKAQLSHWQALEKIYKTQINNNMRLPQTLGPINDAKSTLLPAIHENERKLHDQLLILSKLTGLTLQEENLPPLKLTGENNYLWSQRQPNLPTVYKSLYGMSSEEIKKNISDSPSIQVTRENIKLAKAELESAKSQGKTQVSLGGRLASAGLNLIMGNWGGFFSNLFGLNVQKQNNLGQKIDVAKALGQLEIAEKSFELSIEKTTADLSSGVDYLNPNKEVSFFQESRNMNEQLTAPQGLIAQDRQSLTLFSNNQISDPLDMVKTRTNLIKSTVAIPILGLQALSTATELYRLTGKLDSDEEIQKAQKAVDNFFDLSGATPNTGIPLPTNFLSDLGAKK